MPNINSSNNRFINQPVTQTAASYIVSQLNDFIIEVTNTSSVITITLPAPSATGNVGKAYIIKDTSGGAQTNNIFITPASGLIDGAVSAKISSNYGSIQVFCDGTNYYSFGSNNSGSFIVNERVFTSSGTYTPTAGMLYCEVEMVGGGGAGGGAVAPGSTGNSSGSGGGSGEYACGFFSSSQIGGSQSISIGAGGTANSGAAGGNGGITSMGSSPLISALGGIGGLTVSNTTLSTSSSITGGLGGSGGVGGAYRVAGSPGSPGTLGYIAGVSINTVGGNGGSSYFGGGGLGPAQDQSNIAGGNGLGYGSGGGGGVANQLGSAKAGGAGAVGAVFITEYIATSAASLPVIALAKAAWNQQSSQTSFAPGATVVQISFTSDAGTTPSNTGSRIDLSALTQNEGSGLTISQFQIAIAQAGTYQIIGSSAFFNTSGGISGNFQCVKNGTTVLGMGILQDTFSGSSIETGSFVVTAELAAGDTIDFRASSNQATSFSFRAISLAINQLPTSTIVPLAAWNMVAGTAQLMSPNNNYYPQSSSLTTFTLPIAAAAGTTMQIAGGGSGGWILAQNAGQTINFGNQATTTGTGGSIASQNQYDGVGLLCLVASTQWAVISATGNLKLV